MRIVARTLVLCFIPFCASSRPCDLGPSDVLFLIESSYDIDKYDFDEVKEFVKDFVGDLDIGFGAKQSRVGVIVFDKTREPEYRIKFAQFHRSSSAQKAISGIRRLPCGYWWCKSDPERTPRKAVDFALRILNEESGANRMKKLVLLLHGKQSLVATQQINSLAAFDPLLRIAQLLVVPDITEADDPYYRYLLSYYQPYERYLGRFHQLYPNVTLPQVQQTYNPNLQLPYSKQTRDNVITLQSYDFICTVRRDLCNLLFDCPPCGVFAAESAVHNSPNNAQNMAHISSPVRFPYEMKGFKTEVNGKDERLATPFEKSMAELVNASSSHWEYNDDYSSEEKGEKLEREERADGESHSADNLEESFLPLKNHEVSPKVPDVKKQLNDTIRRKRQTYSIYPINSQERCTCPASSGQEISAVVGDRETDSLSAISTVTPPFVKAAIIARRCIEDALRNDKAAYCECTATAGSNPLLASVDLATLSEGPLSKEDFETFENFQSHVDCSALAKGKTEYVNLRRGNEAGGRRTTDAKRGEILTNGANRSAELPLEFSKVETFHPMEREFRAGFSKWLAVDRSAVSSQAFPPLSSDSSRTPPLRGELASKFEGIGKWSSFTGRKANLLEPHNDNLIHHKAATDNEIEYEEFISEPHRNSAIDEGTNGETIQTSGQSLISLTDPKSGKLPELPPPTLPPEEKFAPPVPLIVRTSLRKTSDLLRLPAITVTQHRDSERRLKQMPRAAAAFRGVERATLEEQSRRRKCIFEAIDIVVYIDDSDAMRESDFLEFRKMLTHIFRLFKTDRRTCERVARLGILKNLENGALEEVLRLDNPLNDLQRSLLISSMNYAGCRIQERDECRLALPKSYSYAAEVFDREESDRKRVLVAVTARSKKRLLALHFDLLEAVQIATKKQIEVFAIAVGNNFDEERLKGTTTNGIVFILDKLRRPVFEVVEFICQKITPNETEIVSKQRFCPWLPIP